MERSRGSKLAKANSELNPTHTRHQTNLVVRQPGHAVVEHGPVAQVEAAQAAEQRRGDPPFGEAGGGERGDDARLQGVAQLALVVLLPDLVRHAVCLPELIVQHV